MLCKLHIENIALIDELDVDFYEGFTVLTGETGAGKSILIDSLNLILGERADRSLIKSGTDRALVEAIFEVPEAVLARDFADQGIDPQDGQVVLSRELTDAGRNICRVNGHLSSLSMLREVAQSLVDIYGQHEHQSLFDRSTHKMTLDRYGEKKIAPIKEMVEKAYQDWKRLNDIFQHEIGDEAQRLRKIDQLRTQSAEIDQAKLQTGEEEALLEERHILSNAENIQSQLHGITLLLNGDDENNAALQSLRAAGQKIESLSSVSQSFKDLYTRLNELYFQAEEVFFEVRALLDDAAFNPYRYEEVEQRLEQMATLKRKYGEDIETVIGFGEAAKAELERLVLLHEQAETLEDEIESKARFLYDQCQTLHQIRKEVAASFEVDLLKQLHDLGMEKAQFEIAFSEFPEYSKSLIFSVDGLDEVEMMLSTNPGEPLKPLRKVASGGELSRIMLAFKSLIANQDETITMVFDEIDTGISGRISSVVGEKMRTISREHQVICVTHSPQIAAMADTHYLIQKQQGNNQTTTNVHLLNEEEHILEIARIAGGTKTTEQTIAYARDLVQSAKAEQL